MIDAGVPAGPTKPFQPITSKPGRPDCAIVGILRGGAARNSARSFFWRAAWSGDAGAVRSIPGRARGNLGTFKMGACAGH